MNQGGVNTDVFILHTGYTFPNDSGTFLEIKLQTKAQGRTLSNLCIQLVISVAMFSQKEKYITLRFTFCFTRICLSRRALN